MPSFKLKDVLSVRCAPPRLDRSRDANVREKYPMAGPGLQLL